MSFTRNCLNGLCWIVPKWCADWTYDDFGTQGFRRTHPRPVVDFRYSLRMYRNALDVDGQLIFGACALRTNIVRAAATSSSSSSHNGPRTTWRPNGHVRSPYTTGVPETWRACNKNGARGIVANSDPAVYGTLVGRARWNGSETAWKNAVRTIAVGRGIGCRPAALNTAESVGKFRCFGIRESCDGGARIVVVVAAVTCCVASSSVRHRGT